MDAGRVGGAAVQGVGGGIITTGANGLGQVEQVDVAGTARVVLTIVTGAREIPGEVTLADLEAAFQAGLQGDDVVVVGRITRTDGDRTVVPGIDGDAERVERHVRSDTDFPLRATGTGDRSGQRHFGQLLVRVTLGVVDTGVGRDVIGHLETAGGEQVQALGRLLQVVDRREVVTIGVGEQTEVSSLIAVAQIGLRIQGIGATGGNRRTRDREATVLAGSRAVRADAAVVVEATGIWFIRNQAITGHDFFLFAVADRQHGGGAFTGGTDGDVGRTLSAVTFGGLTVGNAELGAFEVFAGDDVDHTGDGIGTVDGRGAVLQDVDAFNDGDRDGRQVNRTVDVGNPALAINQDEGTIRTQATEGDVLRTVGTIGLGGGGGQTRTVRRRDVVQDVEHVGQTGFFDIGAGHHGDRLGGFSINALNTRTGNFHAIQSFGFFFFLGKGGDRCCGRGGANKQCKLNCI